MPKAYLIAHVRVHDQEEFERFEALSQRAVAEHACRVLAHNPDPELKEGDVTGTVILIEFGDMEAARTFYDSNSYSAARAERQVSAKTDLVLVEGL